MSHKAVSLMLGILLTGGGFAADEPGPDVSEMTLTADQNFGNEDFGFVVTLPEGWSVRWKYFDHPTANKSFAARDKADNPQATCEGGRALGHRRKGDTQESINDAMRSGAEALEAKLRQDAEAAGGNLDLLELSEVEGIVGLRIKATNGKGIVHDMITFETPPAIYTVTCTVEKKNTEAMARPIGLVMASFKPTVQR